MRKITEQSVRAFFSAYNFKSGNMEVNVDGSYGISVRMYLHGNCIATWSRQGGELPHLSDCGWQTTTTRDRLNGILAHYGWAIVQRDWEWILVSDRHHEEKPWTGSVSVERLKKLDMQIMEERNARYVLIQPFEGELA